MRQGDFKKRYGRDSQYKPAYQGLPGVPEVDRFLLFWFMYLLPVTLAEGGGQSVITIFSITGC